MLSKSVKEIDTETWKWLEIEWYASTKDKDRYGDIVKPEAFEKAMNTEVKDENSDSNWS